MTLTATRLNLAVFAAIAAVSLAACSPKEEAEPPAAAFPPPPPAPAPVAPTALAPSPLASVLMLATQPASSTTPENDWARVAKFGDVTWKWGADKVEANDYTMSGTLPSAVHKLNEIPDIDITVGGARTMFQMVKAEFFSPQGVGLGPEDLKLGTLTRVTTTCDDESASNALTFHKVEAEGKKPFFLKYESSGGSGGTSVSFTTSDSQDMLIGSASMPGAPCKPGSSTQTSSSTTQSEPGALPPIPAGSVDRVRDHAAALAAKSAAEAQKAAPANAVAQAGPSTSQPIKPSSRPSEEEVQWKDGRGMNPATYHVKRHRIFAACTGYYSFELAQNVAMAAANDGGRHLGAVLSNKTNSRFCSLASGTVSNAMLNQAYPGGEGMNHGYFIIKTESPSVIVEVPRKCHLYSRDC